MRGKSDSSRLICYGSGVTTRRAGRLLRLVALFTLFLGAMFLSQPVDERLALAASSDLVYVAKIKNTIDSGLVNYLKRVYGEAEEAGAAVVLLEINTPGGLANSAIEIVNLISTSGVETISFIRGGAISAGALIALASHKIYMAPGGTIGAAEPRLGSRKVDEKTLSWWSSQLAGAAEAHGRNRDIASAMADADIAIPGVVEKGKLLTLTAGRAVELGMADGLAANREAALEAAGLGGARLKEVNPSVAETMARWMTGPVLGPLLLTIGLAGLVIEIFTVGFGIAGIIGIAALGLYFAGSIAAGLTGWEALFIFIVGLAFLLVEIFVIPGFGVTGIAGVAALTGSIFLASPSAEQAATSLVVAFVGTVALLTLSLRYLPTRRVWQRLVLKNREETEAGYVAPDTALELYLGQVGSALTPLRPAGVALIANERVDVVSEGGFIPAGKLVKVVKVDGMRVVVREQE